MSVYLDASLVVALLTPEEHSDSAEAWFARQPAGTLFVSGWVVTEVSSALAMKLRSGTVMLEQRAAALQAWGAIRASSLLTLAVTEDHFEQAARVTDQHALGLRAGGALHIAVARDAGCTLATFDKRMAEAARQLGLAVEKL